MAGAQEARWRDECETRRLSAAEDPKDRKRVFRDSFQVLRDRGLVAARDGLVWIASKGADQCG